MTANLDGTHLFRISPLGTVLRQLTRFGQGVRSLEGCAMIGETPGCPIDYVEPGAWPGRRLFFYSDCDPFGTNPDGSQVFAIDYDGAPPAAHAHGGCAKGCRRAARGGDPRPTARGGGR